MTADALPVSGGTSKDLDDLFDRVVGKLKPFLQAEQLASLTTVGLCQLRHDLLHCRFSKAYGKLGGKGNDPSVVSVFKIGDGQSVLEAVNRGVSGGAVPVAQTKTPDAGIPAWVAQAGSMGTFASAAKTFEEACKALHVGLSEHAKEILRGAEPGR